MMRLQQSSPSVGWRRFAIRVLPYVMIAAAAVYVRRELLDCGFIADDYAQLGMLDGTYPLRRGAYELFTFSDGTPLEGQLLIDTGFYPWWSDPNVRIAMFRPLASVMTALDFRAFGNTASSYHIHSLLWWLLLLAAVAAAYRSWFPTRTAILAFALYAASNAHGLAVGWVCNRSAIVSSLLTLTALRIHVGWRKSESGVGRITAPVMYGLGLGFGEYALCGLGYLVAYEWRARIEPAGARSKSG